MRYKGRKWLLSGQFDLYLGPSTKREQNVLSTKGRDGRRASAPWQSPKTSMERTIVKHKLEHIQILKEMLSQLPPVEAHPAELTTQEAVRMLRPEVTSLQRKGYSFEMIAQVLENNGFNVTASTLKKYRSARKQDPVRRAGKKNLIEASPSAPAKPRTTPASTVKRTRQADKNDLVAPQVGGFTPLEDTRDI